MRESNDGLDWPDMEPHSGKPGRVAYGGPVPKDDSHYADWCGEGRFVGEGRGTREDSRDVLRWNFKFEFLSGRAEDDGVEFSKIRDDRIGPQNRRRCPRSSRPSKASVLRANTMEHVRVGRGACDRRILNGTDQSD